MQLKKVAFRWLTRRPVAIDIRKESVLRQKYNADALVLCMWIDSSGFMKGTIVAGISLQEEPVTKQWYDDEIPFRNIEDCEALLSLRPSDPEQRIIWNIRKRISMEHPDPEELISVRKTVYLDRFRLVEKPDIVICYAESGESDLVPVHTDCFSGTQLLGTVVSDDRQRILHKNDRVMIYRSGVHHLNPILIATRSIYE